MELTKLREELDQKLIPPSYGVTAVLPVMVTFSKIGLEDSFRHTPPPVFPVALLLISTCLKWGLAWDIYTPPPILLTSLSIMRRFSSVKSDAMICIPPPDSVPGSRYPFARVNPLMSEVASTELIVMTRPTPPPSIMVFSSSSPRSCTPIL